MRQATDATAVRRRRATIRPASARPESPSIPGSGTAVPPEEDEVLDPPEVLLLQPPEEELLLDVLLLDPPDVLLLQPPDEEPPGGHQ